MTKWREVKIKDLGKIVGGGTPSTKREEYWNGDIPWLSPKDLSNHNNRYVGHGSRNITKKGLKNSSTRLLPKGTLLFTSRAPIGYIAIAKNEICTNQGFKNIVCNSNLVNVNFLYYYLKINIDYIKLFATGATFPEISAKRLKNIKIKIPDLKTQEKIAKVLSTYDELIENNNRRIELLEQMAEEIYKEWFVRMRFPGHDETKFEKGIPEGWEVKRVKDIVSRLKAGYYYKKDEVFENGDIIVIDQSEKPFLGFHFNRPDHVADIDSPIILFGDHSCKMNLMIRNFSVSENVIPFKSVEKNNEIFLFYATKRLIETQEYKRHWNEFTNKKIFIPDDILKLKFINNVRDIILQIQKYKEQNQNLIKQRDMLLPRLMNGTIEVE